MPLTKVYLVHCNANDKYIFETEIVIIVKYNFKINLSLFRRPNKTSKEYNVIKVKTYTLFFLEEFL